MSRTGHKEFHYVLPVLNVKIRRKSMRLERFLLPVCGFLLLASLISSTAESSAGNSPASLPVISTLPASQDGDKLVYADFETVKDNRPVSSRGGYVQLYGYQQHDTSPSRFKGLEATNAPELVRLRKDDPNRAAAFDFELPPMNEYAGVMLEVRGQADKDGKIPADDVSRFKYVTLQVYATGVTYMRVEFISKGNGIEMNGGYPQSIFKVAPSLNTYKIPLNAIAQPTWQDQRINPKEVLKKLTSLNLVAFCEKCALTKGTIVVDNVVFQN
jgi:hypothetical protein